MDACKAAYQLLSYRAQSAPSAASHRACQVWGWQGKQISHVCKSGRLATAAVQLRAGLVCGATSHACQNRRLGQRQSRLFELLAFPSFAERDLHLSW